MSQKNNLVNPPPPDARRMALDLILVEAICQVRSHLTNSFKFSPGRINSKNNKAPF
ncbi:MULTISPECIES: hypothetical protein [unclassified Microcoleus]|uniref:hypothetical protein n=1 Tax=unclassified Microcoleus TaxID=2642155 RepID=UPI00312B6A75